MTTYGIPSNEAGTSQYAEQDISKLTPKYNAKGTIVYSGVACIGGVDGTVTYRKFDRSSNRWLNLSEAEYQQLKQQDPTAVQGYDPHLGATVVVCGDATGNRLPGYLTARSYLSLASVSGRQPGRSNIFTVVALGRRPQMHPYTLMSQAWPRDPNNPDRANLDIPTVVLWALAGWDQTPIWEVTLSRAANGALYVNEYALVPDHVHAFYNQLFAPYRSLPSERRFVTKEGAYGIRYQPNYKELERLLGKRLTVQQPQVTTQGPSGPSGAPQAALQVPSQITPHAAPQNGQQVAPQVTPQIVPPASSQVTQPTPSQAPSQATSQFAPPASPQAPSQATSQFAPPTSPSAAPAAPSQASSQFAPPASSQLIPPASPPASSPAPSQFTPPTQPQAPQQDAPSALTPQSGEAPTIPLQFKL